jgi:hypothetical protein
MIVINIFLAQYLVFTLGIFLKLEDKNNLLNSALIIILMVLYQRVNRNATLDDLFY